MIFFVAFVVSFGLDTTTMADVPTAIKGYDPVAYFTDAKALKGDASVTYAWGGMTWHFSSVTNRDLFSDAPERYAPQYAGY